MATLNLEDVVKFVENTIGDFHKSRLDKVKSIKLKDVVAKKILIYLELKMQRQQQKL
jgi:hypothetical protein